MAKLIDSYVSDPLRSRLRPDGIVSGNRVPGTSQPTAATQPVYKVPVSHVEVVMPSGDVIDIMR